MIQKRNKPFGPKLPYCFIIWGISDSGKDTVYNLINEQLPTVNIKLSQPCKDTLEKWLNLSEGSLNDKNFRTKFVTNIITGKQEDYTYDDILVRAFKAWNDMVPGGWLTVGYIAKIITDEQNPWFLKKNIAFTDVRRHCELEMIKQLADKFNLVFIHVAGRGTQKSSDKELKVKDFMFIDNMYWILNTLDVNIDQLESKVQRVLSKLNEE